MKKIFLIGTALLLMVLPLAGCGVPQEDLDAAEADRDAALAQVSSLQSDISKAKSDLTTAKSDLASTESALADAESDLAAAESAKATAQSGKSTAESAKAAAESDLATAESALADTEAQIADLEAEVAALEAPAEEEVVEEEVVEEEVVEEEEEVVEEEEEAPAVTEVETSFEAAEYVNEDPAFSVKYLSNWTVQEISEEAAAGGLVMHVAGDFVGFAFPFMQVYVITEGGDTIADVLMALFGEDTEVETTTETTLADGTAAFESTVFFIFADNYWDSRAIGTQKDGTWIIALIATVGQYVAVDEAQYSEMLHTLLLQ